MLASGALELVVPMQVLIDAPSVARSPGNPPRVADSLE
jgi:hypothetical protein